MELLGWRSVKDISGDGGVIKTITKEGSDWQKPNDRDEVLGECLLACHTVMPRLRCPCVWQQHALCCERALREEMNGFACQQWVAERLQESEHLNPEASQHASARRSFGPVRGSHRRPSSGI